MPALSRGRQLASPSRSRRPRRRINLWFERVMAILALLNLLLVIGDLTYIRFRDQYLRFLPEVTQWYGETYKGIEPHRETTAYLELVSDLQAQVSQTGLQSAEAQEMLADLRQQSLSIVNTDPFQAANKSGTLERIKEEIRERVDTASAQEAFETFWTVDYLSQAGWPQEIAFFNEEVRPKFETNYFRRIGVDGAPIDWFWKIDGWFILIFGLEFVARTLYLSRRYKNLTWWDAVLWRWYDLLLIIPFSALHLSWFALLRVIPVSIRLNQSRTLNLEPFWGRVNRFFVSQIAVEVTEVVFLRIIDQVQNLIREGDIADALLSRKQQRYIGVNDINEIQAISQELSGVMIYRVLPKIKPEVDALLYHNIRSTLNSAPGYETVSHVPGMESLADQLPKQLAGQLSTSLFEALKSAFEDERGAELMAQLINRLTSTLQSEIQEEESLAEIEDLSVALLEEIKINYVKRIAAEDIDRLNEQRYQIYDVTQEANGV
jgi:hypothetical protein